MKIQVTMQILQNKKSLNIFKDFLLFIYDLIVNKIYFPFFFYFQIRKL